MKLTYKITKGSETLLQESFTGSKFPEKVMTLIETIHGVQLELKRED